MPEKNRGWFAPNQAKDKDHPKWPDWKGFCWVNGVEYELAGWTRTNDKGKYLSLAITPVEEARKRHENPIHPTPEDDEIPF